MSIADYTSNDDDYIELDCDGFCDDCKYRNDCDDAELS